MCPATKSGRSESGPFVTDDYFYDCFHKRSITYGCKIVQLYEYNANVYEYDANCE